MRSRGKRLLMRVLAGMACMALVGLLLPAEAGADQESAAVTQKVSQVVDEVITPDMSEKDKALALHDWLVDNAYYDETFTYYGADGVLLHQTGVCQSYTEAYRLLLEKAGIECRILTGNARKNDGTMESHAWNLVKIDGVWSHVDVTWDDPIDGNAAKQVIKSGLEEHYYFLVSSRYIMEDHIPDEESAAVIRQLADTSDEADEGLLPSPVKTDKRVEMPDFSMKTASGKTLTRDGYGKGKRLLMVYGRTTCPNTRIFMSDISPYVNILKNSKVTVVLALYDDPPVSEMKEMEKLYPGIVCAKLPDNDSSMWEGLYAMGDDSGSVIFPVVFLKNAKNAITYYSTGYVEQPLRVVSGAMQMKDEAPEKKAGTASETGSDEAGTDTEETEKSTDRKDTEETEKSAGQKDKAETAVKTGKVTIGKALYKLSRNKTAVFLRPKSKSVSRLSIPATVKCSGTVYKVTGIAKNACKGLKKLIAVTIGSNVKTIGAGAFKDCKVLRKITIKTGKLKSSAVGSNAFKGIAAKAKIKVPAKKLSAYKKLLKKKGIGKKATISK